MSSREIAADLVLGLHSGAEVAIEKTSPATSQFLTSITRTIAAGFAVTASIVFPALLAAQDAAPPPPDGVVVESGIPYSNVGGRMQMDIVRPARGAARLLASPCRVLSFPKNRLDTNDFSRFLE